MPSNYVKKGTRPSDIIARRTQMITRENKQLQALAMIDGAVAKRMLAEQLQHEAEKDMALARQILNEIKEAENAAG